ncbi:claudin-16-like isoform X2 [Hemicordylus capensis]|uniref:claudin-16-like isoform X2 n=1 Tax=Hemicordylus capensis TaxID=884348 RepID=UPI002304BEB4|nr:claudin-16-like isoform X2 [Hemicordylus capensis]
MRDAAASFVGEREVCRFPRIRLALLLPTICRVFSLLCTRCLCSGWGGGWGDVTRHPALPSSANRIDACRIGLVNDTTGSPRIVKTGTKGVAKGEIYFEDLRSPQDAKDPLSSVDLSNRCRGLWSECVFDNVANLWTCDIPISYLSEHPAVLVTTRILLILSSFLTLAAVAPFIAGMKCIKLFRDGVPQKYKFSLVAGILFLLGGLSGAIAVLWYGIDTVQKYKLEVSLGIPGVTYELGYSYWMAVAGMACASSTGVLLIAANSLNAQMPRKALKPFRSPPDSKRQGTYL